MCELMTSIRRGKLMMVTISRGPEDKQINPDGLDWATETMGERRPYCLSRSGRPVLKAAQGGDEQEGCILGTEIAAANKEVDRGAARGGGGQGRRGRPGGAREKPQRGAGPPQLLVNPSIVGQPW